MAFYHKFKGEFIVEKLDKDYMFEDVNQRDILNAIWRKPRLTKRWSGAWVCKSYSETS